MRQTDGDLHQRDKQARFAHQPGNDQKHAHLLKQQQHQLNSYILKTAHAKKRVTYTDAAQLSLKHPKKA